MQDEPERKRCFPSGHRAHQKNACAKRGGVNTRRRVRTADEIEDNVGAGATSPTRDMLCERGGIVTQRDALLEPILARALDLLRGAGISQWHCTGRSRQLHSGEAHAAAHGMNKDVL